MMQIFLYSDDINLLSYWESILGENTTIVEEFSQLESIKNSLIIINYSAFHTSQVKSIKKFKENLNSVLVLHRVPNVNVAKELLSQGASGYGNALMKAHFLLSAIDAIEEGLVWLHPEFISQLIIEIPQKEDKFDAKVSALSQREKEVAKLLKDGLTYKEIALELGITPRTIKAHASSIYTKLHVKDRVSLALFLK